MSRTREASIRTKVTAALLAAIALALALSTVAIAVFELGALPGRVRVLLDALAEPQLEALGARIAFPGADAGEFAPVLDDIAKGELVVHAWLQLPAGKTYRSDRAPDAPGRALPPAGPGRAVLELAGTRAFYARAVLEEGRPVGTLVIEADITPFRRSFDTTLAVLGAVFLSQLALGALLARFLQRAITGPILALADTAAKVHETGDYAVRHRVATRDEIGRLGEQFNEMLAGIAARDARIAAAHAVQAAIFAHSGVAIITTDPAGTVLSFNPAAERLLGYTAAETVGRLSPLAWHDPREIAARAAELSAQLGRPVPPAFETLVAEAPGGTALREWTFVRQDGRRVPVYLAVSTLRDAAGRTLGYCGMVTDLSARRAAEAAVRESEEQLRQVLDASPVALALIDSAQRRWLYVNRRFTDWFGYTLADMPDTEHWWTLAYPDPAYRAEVRELWRERGVAAGETGEVVPLEAVVTCRGGATRRIEFRSQRFKGRSLVAMTDVTERKIAEDALRASEEQFKLLTEHAPDAIVVLDLAAEKFVAANAAAERLFQRPRAALFAAPFGELSPERQPDGRRSADAARDYIGAAIAGETPTFEWRHLAAGGREVACEIRLLRLPHPTRMLIRGSMVDLSERKRTEVALRALTQGTAGVAGEAFFAAAVAQVAQELHVRAVLIGELQEAPERRVRTLARWIDGPAAPVTYALAGTPCEDVVAHAVCHHPERVAELFPRDAMLRDLGAQSYLGTQIRDHAGRPLGLVAVLDDKPMPDSDAARLLLAVTAARAATEIQRLHADAAIRRLNTELEQRVRTRTAELQERIAEVERLNTDLRSSQQATGQAAASLAEANTNLLAANQELEAFSYSVSHDLRAPLRNITGFIELLRKRSAGRFDADGERFIGIVTAEAQRMGALIDDLLTFSRIGRTDLRPAPVDLAALVAEARQELAADTQGREIEWRIGALPPVQGDRTLLRQVVVNLLANAVKFSQRRRPAVIEVGHRAADDGSGEDVFFVRDNGAGFNPKYSDKLFRVFQRLHSARDFEGTGIGLANVKRIVTRHGGRVWADGALDAGATFFFTLRRSPVPPHP